MSKLKVTAVSYLNTKPFLYGILNSPIAKLIDLQLDIPSDCARKLEKGEVDLGLVPVAVIPALRSPQIISNYCIGTLGAVKTVAIFSECPLEEVTHLYLDHHSRTSVALAKVLLKHHWKVQPILLQGHKGYIQSIRRTRAGLIIGDRTIEAFERFPFVYDLGEAWWNFTALPFVFAAWVSNGPLPQGFIKKLNSALKKGIDKIGQLMYLLPSPHPNFDLEAYFTKFISYELDDKKRKALSKFLKLMELTADEKKLLVV